MDPHTQEIIEDIDKSIAKDYEERFMNCLPSSCALDCYQAYKETAKDTYYWLSELELVSQVVSNQSVWWPTIPTQF
jgi:hypothetical protein